MPRPGIFFPGMLAACALAACTAVNEANTPEATPTPSIAPATSAATLLPWTESLSFSGDLTGQMTTIVASGPGQQSECSGRTSATAGRWDSAIFGPVGAGVYGVVFSVSPYRGPGTYSAPDVTVQVHSLDNQRVWLSGTATLVVAPDERSGTLDATLTNQVDTSTQLRVTGTWSCG